MAVQDLGNGKVRVLCFYIMCNKDTNLDPEGWANSQCKWAVFGFKPHTVIPIKVKALAEHPLSEDRYYPATSYGSGEADSCWLTFDKEFYEDFINKNSVETFLFELKQKRNALHVY